MMGYRSDVQYVIMFPNEQHAKEFIAVNRVTPQGAAAIDELSYVGGEYPILFADFEYTKWYESYPEVQAHENLMSAAKDAGYCVAFARIGEELDDMDLEYNEGEHDDYDGTAPSCYDLINVHRSIELDIDTTGAMPPKDIFNDEGEAN